jgi:hypothetical protein
MEAAIMGRSTLSIVPRIAEKQSLPTIMAGITPCVTTREELQAVLPELLKKSRQRTEPRTTPFVHHGSLQKTVSFIERILSGYSPLHLEDQHGRKPQH